MVRGQFKKKTFFSKFGMGEARNVKFGTLIDLGKSHLTRDKTHANWSRGRIFKFWDHLHIFS